ncbi:hypothetical protein M3201_00050 [Paenibacillus motobuensis]|nr:hypothetical protein [Paenibacillus lutimineralis]MCM3645199.1 hypothetical protein [Paenibacillus motobuensis]
MAILITDKLAELGMDVETLITIAAPIREYKLETSVGQFIHVYNNWDVVQTGGGALKKGIVTFKRKFQEAENIEVKLPRWRRNNMLGVSNHSYMHSSIKVWKKYIEPRLK